MPPKHKLYPLIKGSTVYAIYTQSINDWDYSSRIEGLPPKSSLAFEELLHSEYGFSRDEKDKITSDSECLERE